jgi:hypothetical protein
MHKSLLNMIVRQPGTLQVMSEAPPSMLGRMAVAYVPNQGQGVHWLEVGLCRCCQSRFSRGSAGFIGLIHYKVTNADLFYGICTETYGKDMQTGTRADITTTRTSAPPQK